MEDYLISVGQKIIDSEQIHIVSKIENNRVYYYPLIQDTNKGNITSSIPLSNLSKADIRPLMSLKEVKIFLKQIKKESPLEISDNTNKNNNSLKEILYLNDSLKTARLLIYLNQHQKNIPLSRFDQSIFDQALKHLAEEIAVVSKITFESAKKQILSVIKK